MIEIVLANARELVTELQSEGRGIILIMIAMGWFLSLGVRMVYPALLPRIRITYGMTLTTAGALLTTLWLAYAFGQLPAGMLADRVGEGRVMMVSTLVSAGTITLVVIAQSTILLFVATALFGLTTALYGVARFTSLSNLYPENDGAAIGLTMGAGDMGNAVLPPIAGFITAMLAWQFGFGMMIPMFLLAGIGIWIYVPMQTSGPAREFLTVAKARYVLSSISQPNILVIATIQVLIYCVWQALTGFYPTYLVEVKGFEATTAGILFGFFFSLGMVIKPLSGASYDRFDAKAPLRVLLVALLVALVILPFTTELWMVIAVTVPLSGVLGYSAITLPYMTGGIPEDIRNTGLGTLRTSYMAIGALSPTLVGSLADHDYFDETFFLMAGLVVVALVVSLRVPEK